MYIITAISILTSHLLITSAQHKPNTKWHINNLKASCSSPSACDYSLDVIGNSIPRYPGFQASCSAHTTSEDTTYRPCRIETTSDTLRAGGESGVREVNAYVKLEVGKEGEVSVEVRFDAGDGKFEIWQGHKTASYDEFIGSKRGFDFETKFIKEIRG